MAWLAVFALVGLGLCGLWALADRLRTRQAGSTPARGVSARRSTSDIVLGVAIGVGAIVLVGVAVFVTVINISGSGTNSGGGQSVTSSRAPQHVARPVRVEVLNASHVPKAAAKEATILSRFGYVITGTADAPTRQGNAVECSPQLGAQAKLLAQRVGPGTVVDPQRQRTPAGTRGSDCAVLLGR